MSSYASSTNFRNGFPTPGPQSPTGQEVMDHIFFASNEAWKAIREESRFDHIIVGSGFCAMACVERILVNTPSARILLLEKGPFFLPEHFQNLPLMFQSTLGGISETFPWTLSLKTVTNEHIQYQFGIVPFFGGRSTVWSAWCPRPTRAEMEGWPEEVIRVCEAYFSDAEKLLNVIPADEIRAGGGKRPVYGLLQHAVQDLLLKGKDKVPRLTRIIPAPLAVKDTSGRDVDFAKFSVPGRLLELIGTQQMKASCDQGCEINAAANCDVRRIIQQNGTATALETSRGIVAIGGADLILAMGTLPATTLVHNSFPQVERIGQRFTSHFITSVVARVHKDHLPFTGDLADLELGAYYLAGVDPELGHKGQFHIQLTSLFDNDPVRNAVNALRHMPDVVATATIEQLLSSKDHIVFVCATLGELDSRNADNWFHGNDGQDITVNSTLQVVTNANDLRVWDTMDEATFQTLERIISDKVEYWHNNARAWRSTRPERQEYRKKGLVHDASTMWIGGEDAVVGTDYRPNHVNNVYITGGALWPAGGSWNPTLTMVAMAQHLADRLTKANTK